MALPMFLFPIAQQWIDSSTAGMINGAVPLISASVAAILLRRLPGRVQMVGLGIGFVGVALIAVPGFTSGGSTLLGVVLVMTATVCYGVALNLVVPLQQRFGALPVLWRSLIVAAVVTLPFGVAGIPSAEPTLRSTAALVALGILGTGLAFVAMANLVGRAGSTRGAIAIYFIPMVAIVLGVVVLDEQVAGIAILGIAFVLLGAWLTSRTDKRARSA
jgi:drug/metabolite transporter (DMT)-like permease